MPIRAKARRCPRGFTGFLYTLTPFFRFPLGRMVKLAIALEKSCVIMHVTEYCNERIEAQLSRLAPVSKACKAVAGVKGAAAEGGEAANPAWSLGEYPFDCRICGELWIDCNFPAPVLGRIVGIVFDRQPMQIALAADLFRQL